MWGTFTVALLLSLLAGLGVGSAGLFVLFLTLVQGLSQIRAQAANLLLFLFSSAAAMLVYLHRSPPKWGILLLLIPTGLIGALAGAYLADLLPQQLLRRIFGIFLILTGGLGLFAGRRR